MEKQTRKNVKEAKEEKLRDPQIEEQILKSLDEAKTPEEIFQMLLSKYVEKERVSSRAKQDLKVQMENLQTEYNKSVLMKNKLEEVSREQQKLIKSVRNESMQKIREEAERRKERQSRFQSSLNDIKQSLNKNKEENNKLRDDNIEMSKKLKYLTEQYQTRQLQLEDFNEQVQLHRVKLSKLEVEAEMEKVILLREKESALVKLLRCNKEVEQLQKLLRALQTERTHLYNIIKENNVEVPAMPALPPEPEPLQTELITSVVDGEKMDAAAN